MDRDKLKKILVHILIWMVPSSTPIYIILREYMGNEMLFSYLAASIIPCIIAWPIEKWIMERKEYKRKITARRIK